MLVTQTPDEYILIMLLSFSSNLDSKPESFDKQSASIQVLCWDEYLW